MIKPLAFSFLDSRVYSATINLWSASAVCAGLGGPGSGEITVTAAGTGALMYSLDGATAVATNVFSNVANGSHTITVSDDNCSNTIIVGVSCNVVCFVDAGSLDVAAGGCQAVTDGTDPEKKTRLESASSSSIRETEISS